MKYGIFKQSCKNNGGERVVSFTALPNPAKPDEVVILDAENTEAAVDAAVSLLEALGVPTHSLLGNQDTVMADFPDYFVGQIRTKTADLYDTASLAFRISNFIPLHKKK